MNYQSMVEMACYALEHGCKATYAGLGVLLCESPSCLNLACVADHAMRLGYPVEYSFGDLLIHHNRG